MLHLAQHEAADDLLTRDPFALLTGMLLDQQFPMEKAFLGPYLLTTRLGLDRLDPAAVVAVDQERFAAAMAGPPAVHRYHASMGARVQGLAGEIVANYSGDTEALWRDVPTGAELFRRLRALPGFGDQKARIFTALLGKQLLVRPRGWRAAAGDYGLAAGHRSVADVRDPATLARVREHKRALKAAARATISS